MAPENLQSLHPQVELPRGAAALAVLTRAGLRPAATVLGLIETEPPASRFGHERLTLHLDPACATRANTTSRVAVLDEDLLCQANIWDSAAACYCQPDDLEYAQWLDAHAELAALLYTLEFAEDDHDDDGPVAASHAGVLRVVVADFDQARRQATDPDRRDTADAGPRDPLADQMADEALAAVRDLADAAASRVDRDHLLHWARHHHAGQAAPGADAAAATGDQMLRCLIPAPQISFDCTIDPTDGIRRVTMMLGAYGWLSDTEQMPFARHRLAVHAPASVVAYCGGTSLGPAPKTPETAQDVFALHEQARKLMHAEPFGPPDGRMQELLAVALGVHADTHT